MDHVRPLSVLVSALLVAALVLSGCNAGVAAYVNGEAIKVEDVDRQLAQMKKASPQTFAGAEGKKRETDFKVKILESLIQIALVKQAAAKMGITADEKKIDEYVSQTEKQYGGADGLAEALKQSGTDMDQFRELARTRLVIEALTRKLAKKQAFDQAAVTKYYDENQSLFSTRPQVRIRQIVVPSKEKILASQLLGKAKSGDDFAAMAKANSTDATTKSKGGDVGFTETSQFDPAMTTVLGSMKKGSWAMVETRTGWHVFQLMDEKPASTRPLAEVRSQIETILQQRVDSDAFQRRIDELRSQAEIAIVDPELKAAMGSTTATSQP
jgi:parvulin-like peptidyl-prolyl isomerase